MAHVSRIQWLPWSDPVLRVRLRGRLASWFLVFRIFLFLFFSGQILDARACLAWIRVIIRLCNYPRLHSQRCLRFPGARSAPHSKPTVQPLAILPAQWRQRPTALSPVPQPSGPNVTIDGFWLFLRCSALCGEWSPSPPTNPGATPTRHSSAASRRITAFLFLHVSLVSVHSLGRIVFANTYLPAPIVCAVTLAAFPFPVFVSVSVSDSVSGPAQPRQLSTLDRSSHRSSRVHLFSIASSLSG